MQRSAYPSASSLQPTASAPAHAAGELPQSPPCAVATTECDGPMAAVRRMQRGAAACYRRTLRLRVKSSTCARHPRRSAFSHRQKGSLLTHSLTSALTYTHGTHAHTPAHTHRYLSSVVGLPHRTGATRAYFKRSTQLSHTACSASRYAQAGANLDYDRCRRRRRRSRLPLPFPLPLLHFRCRARPRQSS